MTVHFVDTSENSVPMKFINPDIGLKLIEKAGTEHLARSMLIAAQSMIAAKEIFAYKTTDISPPHMLLSCGQDQDAENRAKSFAAHFFISDPIRKTRYKIQPETGFYEHVHISQIDRGDYRWQCFEKPGFTDKLCFGWKRGKDSFVLTFYVQDANELPSTPLFEAFGNVCMTALILHADIIIRQRTPLQLRLKKNIQQRYPSLTSREVEVCSMTLAGFTADSIGNDLGISPNTVFTYRQRAYQKMGINSSHGLLGKLIM